MQVADKRDRVEEERREKERESESQEYLIETKIP